MHLPQFPSNPHKTPSPNSQPHRPQEWQQGGEPAKASSRLPPAHLPVSQPRRLCVEWKEERNVFYVLLVSIMPVVSHKGL